MAKKIKTTFLSCATLDLISIMLQVGISERSVDTLATNIYLDMQKAELDQNKVDKIKTTLNKVNVNASGLFLVHAVEIALETYTKYDLVK